MGRKRLRKEINEALEHESSSSSSSDERSSDDETENALFKPPVKKNAPQVAQDVYQESSSSDSEDNTNKNKKFIAKESDTSDSKDENKDSMENLESLDSSNESKEDLSMKTHATVYVEGIPYKADEGDIVTHFSSCGSVKEVRLPRYHDSGRPRGYAHVVFDSIEAMKKALKLDGEYLFGRYLTVKPSETPRIATLVEKEQTQKVVKGCRTIFIKQLPYDVEDEDIKQALSSCGEITSVRLPYWQHTQKLKGFGYVEFATEDQALAAVKRSGMRIGSRMVLISLDVAGGPKASFRQRNGQYWSKGEEAKKSLAKKMMSKTSRVDGAKKRKTMRN